MSGKPYDVLVVGELNVDLIVRGDVVPEFGQVEKLVDDFSVCAGSSSGIFAAAAAKMGLRVLYVSRVGDDLFGRFLIEAMERAGVDSRFIVRDPAIKTGVGILLSKGEDRAMLTYLGSIAAVTEADIHPEHLTMARHLHVSSPFLLTGLRPAMPELMRAAKEVGMTVSLDTNWDPQQRWELPGFYDHLDLFLPNESELKAITGRRDLEGAIAEMAQRVPLLVVKRGQKGAIAVRGEERLDLPAFPVDVVETTGAGDTFDGGFVAGWLRGVSLRSCTLLGSACGALTTTQLGAFNGQPTWDEAVAYVRHHLGEEIQVP